MQIAIIALGTQGDVQPYVALGKGLKATGYSVRVVTHQNFQTLVESHGLEFCGVTGSVQEILETEEMRALLEKGNFFAVTRQTAKEAERAAVLWARESLDACAGADLLLAGVGGLFVALALAEKLKIPLLQAHLVPFTPTKTFPAVVLPAALPELGGSLNRVSHQIIKQAMWQGFRAADNLTRREVLDLPPVSFWGPYKSRLLDSPVVYGFSPSVIPKPSDWGAETHVTGYWFLDSADDWVPPAALSDFLENGAPPVYIGFGSMSNRKPEETVDLILESLAQTKQRAVLLSGWSGLEKENLPETVFMANQVPHSWLFPRVSAVIHHGGAGTTAAGFRAGVPSAIIPFFADQPFWGRKAAQMGVGAEPIPRKDLTAGRLANALRTVTANEVVRRRAAELGEKIRSENGISNAVSVVTAFLNTTR